MFLPYEAYGVGNNSVRTVFILSNVLNERQDKLDTRLYQHYIGCTD